MYIIMQGCDASILLDSTKNITSEEGSNPNRNSARGFEVIDEIKSELEEACPQVVSCADILALAARESTNSSGGPYWEVALGRRDSINASLIKSNNNIPAPNSTFKTILDKFTEQGLDIIDVVALSGSHTIGKARCASIKQRLYNQTGDSKPDLTLDQSYADQLRAKCSNSGKDDQKVFDLDNSTPTTFDNRYFKNLLDHKGLLNSDQVLVTKNNESLALVKKYADDNACFFEQFAISMIKMGNINVLKGSHGEIRKQCNKVNA
ncbi:Peroxidase 72 [Castilleja foliolosa]|uniref:peroxidase n=1 Tax=Castilleja foliolosa TaxID=1961234 RepID=A0ABD3BC74_9LAMI